MKIVIWSPRHGAYSSSNLMAVAIALSELSDMKVLITQTHFTMNNLEVHLTGRRRDDELYDGIGLDAARKCLSSFNITDEDIDNCSIKLIDNKLYLLPGTGTASREQFDNEQVKREVDSVLEFCSTRLSNTITIVDANSGFSEQSLHIFKDADCIVVNLRQNWEMIKEFFKEKEKHDEFKGKKLYYLFGNSDPDSEMTLRNITGHYDFNRHNTGAIYHNTGYMDAISKNRVLPFIKKRMGLAEDPLSSDYVFFKELIRVSGGILQLAKNKRKVREVTDKEERQRIEKQAIESNVSVRRAARNAAKAEYDHMTYRDLYENGTAPSGPDNLKQNSQ